MTVGTSTLQRQRRPTVEFMDSPPHCRQPRGIDNRSNKPGRRQNSRTAEEQVAHRSVRPAEGSRTSQRSSRSRLEASTTSGSAAHYSGRSEDGKAVRQRRRQSKTTPAVEDQSMVPQSGSSTGDPSQPVNVVSSVIELLDSLVKGHDRTLEILRQLVEVKQQEEKFNDDHKTKKILQETPLLSSHRQRWPESPSRSRTTTPSGKPRRQEEPGTTSVSETKTGADITTISVWTLDKIKEDAVARLPSKFDSVAAESFESCTNSEADLILKPEASPVQMKRFNIVTQFAKTDKDVRHQEDDVNNVNNSHWAAPKVVVKKKKVHNFSTNVNDSLWLHQQQRSSSEDDFNKLIGGQLKQFDYINEFIRLRDVGSTVPGISEIFDSKISAQGATSNADYNVYGRSTNEDRHSMEAPGYHNSFRAHLSMCNTSLLPDAWYIRQLDKDERLDPELGHSKRMPPPLNYDGSQLIKLTDSTIIDDAVAAKDNRSRTSPAASRFNYQSLNWSNECHVAVLCAKELPASYLLNNVKPNMVHAVTADSIDSIGRHRAASLRRHPRETCKQTCRQRHGFNSAKKINTCKRTLRSLRRRRRRRRRPPDDYDFVQAVPKTLNTSSSRS
ncbi:unnamed protein product [Caenorhabditis auriculariae]|uniref:Uncharacterized protein n=1 Tax=Caenorhabditis auriculariae TaxID=2777116 RepID=A0A8S1GP61_9PELO|nr:unnamed protein product [Caenorhabditis auriculariae]